MNVRRAVPGDWRRVRAIRLEALQNAPLAFASTYAREIDFTEEIWRSRTQTSAVFLAVESGETIGTASRLVDRADLQTARLVAMYVVPAARGRRVAEALIDAVVADARATGLGRLVLDVVETNAAARRAYQRYGFTPTGVTSALPHAPELTEIELQLLLR